MNVIFSEINDQSTNYIIDWFIFLGFDFYRDNGDNDFFSFFDLDDFSYFLEINNQNFSINKNNFENLKLNNINSIWYRKPYIGVANFTLSKGLDSNNFKPENLFKNNLKYHNLTFKNLVFYFLNKKFKTLGTSEKSSLNKGIVLLEAQKCGLKIPNTIITNSKVKLDSFFNSNGKRIITKPLYEVIAFAEKSISNISLTSLITNLDEIPDDFSPSLFQSYIDKDYEVRTFFLEGECHSMAIFSQNNSKTIVDFRNYDNEKMNRMIPYKLEIKIEKKIKKLMRNLNLNTGSIDLMKSKNGKYYFLEINPTGQFDFVSKYCNYNLELKIAKYLINE